MKFVILTLKSLLIKSYSKHVSGLEACARIPLGLKAAARALLVRAPSTGGPTDVVFML